MRNDDFIGFIPGDGCVDAFPVLRRQIQAVLAQYGFDGILEPQIQAIQYGHNVGRPHLVVTLGIEVHLVNGTACSQNFDKHEGLLFLAGFETI